MPTIFCLHICISVQSHSLSNVDMFSIQNAGDLLNDLGRHFLRGLLPDSNYRRMFGIGSHKALSVHWSILTKIKRKNESTVKTFKKFAK